MSDEEAVTATTVVRVCGGGGCCCCGFDGEGLVESVGSMAIWDWECFCCEGGDGRSFHVPLYLGLLGFSVSNCCCCSKGEELAPLETYKGLEEMKGEAPPLTTTGDECCWG